MPLSFFAAESLVHAYLNGRILLPVELHRTVVLAAQARLLGGLQPVLDKSLLAQIDENAIASSDAPSSGCAKGG